MKTLTGGDGIFKLDNTPRAIVNYSIVGNVSGISIRELSSGEYLIKDIEFSQFKDHNNQPFTSTQSILDSVEHWVIGGNIGSLDLAVPRGHMVNMTHINKFGSNEDIDSAASEDIWDGGGIYVPPTQNRIHAIASSSIQDKATLLSSGKATGGSMTTLVDSEADFIGDGVTAGDLVLIDSSQDHSIVDSVTTNTLTVKHMHHYVAIRSGDDYRIATSAGTGAMVAHIRIGYKEDGTELNEFVILNGTTPVNTINEYYRIPRMHIHGTGNGSNAGIITVTAATDATVTAQINAGNGQTLSAIMHVPMGSTGFMTKYYASMYRDAKISDAMAKVYLRSRLWGSSNDGDVVEHALGLSINGGEAGHEFTPHKGISQGTDIWLRCEEVTDDNTAIFGGFDMFIVKN